MLEKLATNGKDPPAQEYGVDVQNNCDSSLKSRYALERILDT
jgi:hypothetical protein